MIILRLAKCTVVVTPLHVATTLPDGSERISAGLTEATDTTALEETAVLAIERFANHMGVDLVGIASEEDRSS